MSFNPCCNGKCSGSRLPGRPVRPERLVSILVVMESAQEVRAGFLRGGFPALVSILVVMESAQEAMSVSGPMYSTSSFNPCCNGKCSGRI